MDEQAKSKFEKFYEPKFFLAVVGILAITAVVVVSILRDRFVSPWQNQVSIVGQGKVSYQPDVATVTLGIAIDKAPTADSALAQLNGKATRIIAALDGLGIKKDDIKTEAYALNPQYDYVEGVSKIAGYGANQKLSIKVSDIINNADKVSQVVSTAGSATANEVMGIEFTVSNMNDLKQQAKILAIGDAKKKSEGLARAAGVKLGKVENWYENILQAPDYRVSNAGFGGAEALSAKAAITVPQVPAGTQEIIVEVGLTYEVK